MRVRFYVSSLLLLWLMTLSGCTAVPPSTAPEIIWIGCPHVTSCPVPGNSLKTAGDLAADNRQLEAALASCGLQVEIIKECQEQHDAKPNQLRKALTDSVPLLQRNPDSLNVFIDSGRIVSTLATSLSFEYQYRLNMVITDYTGGIDLLIVPMLEWLRVNEPDIMATKDKQQNGFTFNADVISDTASDISVDLQLSERVIVKRVGNALHVDHVGENPLQESDARPVQMYAGGALISKRQS